MSRNPQKNGQDDGALGAQDGDTALGLGGLKPQMSQKRKNGEKGKRHSAMFLNLHLSDRFCKREECFRNCGERFELGCHFLFYEQGVRQSYSIQSPCKRESVKDLLGEDGLLSILSSTQRQVVFVGRRTLPLTGSARSRPCLWPLGLRYHVSRTGSG